MVDLTVGLVNYNTRNYLQGCLESIFHPPSCCQVEVIMVDNASTDGSVEWVRANYPSVRIIENKHNVGVARGNNQTIRAAQGRYVFLLNTDTILMPGAIDRQVEFLDLHSDAGAVGGKLIFEDGSFQSSYDSFPTLWSEFLGVTWLGLLRNPRFPSNPDCNEIRLVDWISSASLVVRKSAVEQVGMIDETYFIYGDETDLQFRLKQSGWKIYFLPKVKTVHFGGRSLNRWWRRRLVYRGKILYHFKNVGRVASLMLRLMFASVVLLKLPFWCIYSLLPRCRPRGVQELTSNLEVIRLCFRPYLSLRNEFFTILQDS